MNSSDSWEVEWLVAALAPWTVSPHPNFRGDHPNRASALALVTEMRDERDRAGSGAGAGAMTESDDGTSVEWTELLVDEARRSLIVGTQEAAAERLMELSADADLPPGARASAALYAAVALCELERHDVAIVGLTTLVDELAPTVRDRVAYSASQRLIIASLYMQLSTRLAESCNFAQARERVALVLRWLPPLKDQTLQDFAVSSGISWSASTVQRDLIRSIGSHALALKSYLEQFGGQTWVRVVRGRSGWIDMRMHLRSADRDEIVLRDAFERRIEANSNTRHFGRVDADGAGYRSLILAELSGHMAYMRGEREKLGKVLVLERGDDSERVREALRLLRQGRATKALQSTITWIRGQGPTAALVEDAAKVTARVGNAKWCTEEDLLVLEGASDFLSPDQKDHAISAALTFPETPQLRNQLSWSSWERLWKTVTRLVLGSGRHNEVAREAYRYVTEQQRLSQPITNTLARLVTSLDWASIDSAVAGEWTDWAASMGERTDETASLLDAIERSILGKTSPAPTQIGIERAAYVADEGLTGDVAEESILDLAEFLTNRLRAEVRQASQGMLTMGGYQDANVAVAFALRFPSEALWEQIVLHLLDPKVDASLKNLAVERLAENVDDIPPAVATKLRDGISALIASERREDLFSQARSTVFGEAIRLSAALNAAPREEMLEAVLRLASSEVRERIEAAKTIPFCISGGDGTWGHVLLLQLSHDPDPSVRAAAGFALVRSLSVHSDLRDAVYSRLDDLLATDGIKVPLAILHALQRAARLSMTAELKPLLPQVERMAVSSSNFLTRGAAKICLEML